MKALYFLSGIMVSSWGPTGGQRALRRTYGLFGSDHQRAGGEITVSLSLESSATLSKDVSLTTFVHVLPDT